MNEISSGLVVLLGLVSVFIGLIILILVCKLMSVLGKGNAKSQKEQEERAIQPAVSEPVVAAKASSDDLTEHQQFVAAITAAIATDMGTDISGLRVLSIKKV